MSETAPLDEDPRWQKLMARGGMVSLPFAAPDGWPHGPIPPGEKSLEIGEDSLSPLYCTLAGHRFLRALLLLPITGARTVFGFESWASVSEDSWRAFLAARAGGEAFRGSFAWLGNSLPGFAQAEPVPCNLVPGPAGQPPRLQPQPGTALNRAQSDGISTARLAAIYAGAGQDIATLLEG
ncbi:DUF2199 domain-containing protein [Sinisalibacter aestuarii]|uniref:DUF2199 domain-containing protein n=1 Tax=Sinisalibacter aestuarii TaxID=2949426 RepID=A0ABQ5LVM8_9RHOB|nr:DUF2199 domain-containing protein [Sinisalibacter aestuarii]GKY89033.1 hypothetical protein STA1M1_29020 [Sinisalibacter aestuarii]